MADSSPPGWDDVLDARVDDMWADPQHRSFDFWIGEWEMNWRGKTEGAFHHDDEGTWTRQRVFPILGGKALVELAWDRAATAGAPSDRGFSIRYYDEERARWVMAQHWPGAGNDGIAFLDQLIGFEDNGRLSMYSYVRRPQEDGSFQNYHRRYNFADIRAGAFRWDGSNSSDDGKTWATWNIVDARRIRPLDPFGPAGTAWPGVMGDRLCTDAPHGAFDVLEGTWAGRVERADGSEGAARLYAGRLLDGCAVASVLVQAGGPRVFSAMSYSPRLGQWIVYTLDDLPGTGHCYRWSPEAGPGAAFHEAPALAIADEFTAFLPTTAFDNADAATRRTVWQTPGPEALVFQEQVRKSAGGDWSTEATYRFDRINGETP